MKIVIFEGDSAEILEDVRLAGLPTNGEIFAANFRAFAKVLNAQAPDIEIVAPYLEQVTPDTLNSTSGFVFTGSSVNWSTDDARAAPLRRVMEDAFNTGKPVWGSCNGMQLAATVLGGAVGASPNGLEIGAARAVSPTQDALMHPMMAGRALPFASVCIHRDEVQRLPEGGVLMASNAHSPIQAFAYESGTVKFWGTQYHPEYSPTALAKILSTKPEMFPTSQAQIDVLSRAEDDENAAKALGASTKSDFALLPRAQELFNWMQTLE